MQEKKFFSTKSAAEAAEESATSTHSDGFFSGSGSGMHSRKSSRGRSGSMELEMDQQSSHSFKSSPSSSPSPSSGEGGGLTELGMTTPSGLIQSGFTSGDGRSDESDTGSASTSAKDQAFRKGLGLSLLSPYDIEALSLDIDFESASLANAANAATSKHPQSLQNYSEAEWKVT